MRSAVVFLSALVLCGCASACTADSCKITKVTVGMTEAQVRDICGCGEPATLDETVTNGKKHVELGYGAVPTGSFMSVNSATYSTPPPPSDHCSDKEPTVVLDDDHVTAIRTGRSCRRY